MESIFRLLGPLVFVVIMSVAFMKILGVDYGKTLGFWNRHLFRPVAHGLWRLVSWPFRWFGRQTRAAARELLRTIGWTASWPIRLASWQMTESVRQLWHGPRYVARPWPLVIPPRRRRGGHRP